MCHQSHFLGSYNDQDHPWAAKISKQYLLHAKLENLLIWWSWKMAIRTDGDFCHQGQDREIGPKI
jgi:hypothetical protein